MSITWRIKVYDEGFTSRTQPGKANNILTPADAFASLDSFDVEGSGNCLEARFRCVPSLVDIRPRDVIELEVSEDGGSSYTRVYRGYIVVAGNARSTEIEAYKAVGLKQRFYEKVNVIRKIDGDDIATMVSDVHSRLITDSYLPDGVAALSADAPTLSITLGNRFPQLESAGETYDALAAQAGAFVVASGDTYTYDGVTYAAGETVPAAQWGVDADGNFFFKRWQRDAVVAAEDDDDKFVKYNDIEAEKKYDSVRLIYADEVSRDSFTDAYYNVVIGSPIGTGYEIAPSDVIQYPLNRLFDFGGDAHNTAVVKAADPLSIMSSDITIGGVISGSYSYTNLTNINDGNPATYGVMNFGNVRVTPNNPPGSIDKSGGIARFVLQRDSASNALTIAVGTLVACDLFSFSTDDIQEFWMTFLPGHTVFFNRDFTLYLNEAVDSRIDLLGSNIRIYEIDYYFPDVDNGGTSDEDYAKRFLRSVNTDVAEVSQFGSLGSVSQTMTFTPSGESAVDVPVERVSYQLSTRDGLVTTYHLGQAYDAELLSERAVLEALAARSVS